MRGKIDKYGNLYIAGKMKRCPFAVFESDEHRQNEYESGTENIQNSCGDWCALFGEPEKEIIKNVLKDSEKPFSLSNLNLGGENDSEVIKLELCHKTLIFEEFIDERKEWKERIKNENNN